MKILISGGGTGGHIFPALAIADALKYKLPDVEILFVGALGRMEMEKVPAAGYQIIGLPISGLQRKLTFQNLKTAWNLLISLFKSWRLLKQFAPDAVIGVGGYASGPVMKVASWKKIPIFIQEQNSYPGITNKLMAPHARKIFVAHSGMEQFFSKEKIVFSGNPVRKDLLEDQNVDHARKYFGLDSSKKTIGIFGGSLGARALNNMIAQATDLIANDKDLQILWQVGKLYFDEFQNKAISKSANVRMLSFIDRMDLAYAACDLVICRAGALTLSELAVTATPAILIPSPNVAEDHQRKNAESLLKENAAVLILETNISDDIWKDVIDLSSDINRLSKIKENLKRITKNDAANEIAEGIINELKK